MSEPSAITYYHGGPKRLRVGWRIIPPSQSGARCASDYGCAHVHDRNRVYVTTELLAAAMYAAMTPGGGAIFRVEPIGDLEPDPDCSEPGLSFACPAATILERVPFPKRELARIRAHLLISEPDQPWSFRA